MKTKLELRNEIVNFLETIYPNQIIRVNAMNIRFGQLIGYFPKIKVIVENGKAFIIEEKGIEVIRHEWLFQHYIEGQDLDLLNYINKNKEILIDKKLSNQKSSSEILTEQSNKDAIAWQFVLNNLPDYDNDKDVELLSDIVDVIENGQDGPCPVYDKICKIYWEHETPRISFNDFLIIKKTELERDIYLNAINGYDNLISKKIKPNIIIRYDFLEKFLPNYSTSNKIAELQDLDQILNNELDSDNEKYKSILKEYNDLTVIGDQEKMTFDKYILCRLENLYNNLMNTAVKNSFKIKDESSKFSEGFVDKLKKTVTDSFTYTEKEDKLFPDQLILVNDNGIWKLDHFSHYTISGGIVCVSGIVIKKHGHILVYEGNENLLGKEFELKKQ